MKVQKLFGMVLTLVLTLVLVSSAHAIRVCFDYALYRAAQQQSVRGCDLTPPPEPTIHYLDAATLKTHLANLGYVSVSGTDPIAFGNKVYNTPGFAETFLKPGDVMLFGADHAGFARGPDSPDCKPSKEKVCCKRAVCLDHFIPVPGQVTDPFSVDHLPRGPIGHDNVFGGFFEADLVEDFIHKRPNIKGAKPVEVWRPQTLPAANAGQLDCGQVFAGTWSTFGGTGKLGLEAIDAAHGAKWVAFYASYSGGSANCGTGATYYTGYYSGSTDSGGAAACTDGRKAVDEHGRVSDTGRHLMGWYKSRVGVRHGTITISIPIGSCLRSPPPPPPSKGPPLNGCLGGSMFTGTYEEKSSVGKGSGPYDGTLQ